MADLQIAILAVVDHALSKGLRFELFKGSCLHFAQVHHEEIHQHVLAFRVQNDRVQGKIQVEAEEVEEGVKESDYNFNRGKGERKKQER